MKTVSALEMRKNFGQLLDEAAAGERIIIERAGRPRAILVPIEDRDLVDPEMRLAQRREALDELIRMAGRRPFPHGIGARVVGESRDEREAHIAAVIAENRRRRP